MTTPNLCQFWDCDEIIRSDHFLCYDHWIEYQDDDIDECPQCDSYKSAEYDVCLNCYRKPAVVQVSAPVVVARGVGSPDAGLIEELRVLRRNLAHREQLQDYMIFSNETLEQLAAVRPTTEEAMRKVKGVGPAKMAWYGAEFLRAIRERVNRSRSPGSIVELRADSRRTAGQADVVISHPQTPVPITEPQADDPRRYWPTPYRALDGHYVRSRAEWMIDAWLYHHHIVHTYERKLPIAEVAYPDFYLPQGNVYIEFWGKEEDAAYARRMNRKREIYQRNNVKLISLTDADLYNLDDRMPQLLLKYGISVA